MFDITPIQLAASFVSLAALLLFARALRGPRTQQWLGPAADWWELLRRRGLPLLDRLARRRLPGQHYAAYTLSLDEVVGTIDAEAIDIRLGAGQTAEDRISEINDKTGRVSERV